MMCSIGALLPAPNNEHFLAAMKDGLKAAGWIEPDNFDLKFGQPQPATSIRCKPSHAS